MTQHYTAKTPHKKGCSLCGAPILPGDACAMWTWCADNNDGRWTNVRVHETCYVIEKREGIDEWDHGEAFDRDDEAEENGTEPRLKAEARLALEASRAQVAR